MENDLPLIHQNVENSTLFMDFYIVYCIFIYLDTDHGVHVEPGQLPGLYHSDADLIVLGLESVVPGAPRLRPEGEYSALN